MIAVVGTGSIGRRHLENLRTLGCDVLAVSEHRRVPSIDIGGRPVPCVASLEEALRSGPEAVVVGNPTSLHHQTTAAALDAGADVYLEKPSALCAADSADLEDRAAKAGATVAVGQQLRFHPLLERVHETVRSGRLGTILAVEANLGEHLADYHPDEDYRQGYAARRDLGGGVLLTQIHLIDILTWVLGPCTDVRALGGHRSDLEVDVEDSVSFLARTVGDVPVYGHLDYLQRPKRWTLAVTGTGGRIGVDLHAGTVEEASSGTDGSREVVVVDRNALFLAAMADFLEASRSGGPPRCTLADATRSLALVDAIKASMGSGATVPVDDPPTPSRPEVRSHG